MKFIRTFLLITCFSLTTVLAQANLSGSMHNSSSRGRVSTKEDILLLKRDILDGKIKVGQTRLKQFRQAYGDAPNIKETSKKLTYDYGDLKIEFSKNQYFRDWEYDYSQKYLFKDEIDDLRFDLEDGQIVGDFYSYREIVKDYEEPTVAHPKKGDGMHSVYYWSEIKLTFENVIVVTSITGDNLGEVDTTGVLRSGNDQSNLESRAPISSEVTVN